ncbi:MAG: HEAT repeat domain-containing protein [Chloroflexota bacterium]
MAKPKQDVRPKRRPTGAQGSGMVSALHGLLAPHLPGAYLRRYLNGVQSDAQWLDGTALAAPNASAEDYLPLQLGPAAGAPGEGAGPVAASGLAQVVAQAPRVLLQGPVGSGKSALLRALAWQAASATAPDPGLHLATVRHFGKSAGILWPVLVNLETSPGESLLERIVAGVAAYGFPNCNEFLLKKMEEGECLFLLDGGTHLAADRLRDEIADLVARYPHNLWIAAARPSHALPHLPGFLTYQVRGLAAAERTLFAQRCLGQDERLRNGLLAACDRNPSLARLAALPLMLRAMACSVQEHATSAPRLPTLCEACMEMLLERWPRASGRGPTLDRRQLLRAAQELAYRGLGQVLTVGDLSTLVDAGRVPEGGASAQELCAALTEQTGLLVAEPGADGADRYVFLDPLLQSYLAAHWLAAGGAPREALEHASDPAWHDVITILAALAPDGPAFTAALEAVPLPEPERWFLLARCLAEQGKRGESLAVRVADALYGLFEQERPELWEAAAHAIAGLERKQAPDHLRALLLHPESALARRRAALVIGRLGGAWGLPSLAKAITDPDATVAEQAAWALGQIPAAQAVYVLTRALGSPTATVRQAAAQSLARQSRRSEVSREGLAALLDALRGGEDKAEDVPLLAERALIEVGPAALERLKPMADDRRLAARVRGRVAKILALLGDDSGLELLVGAVQSMEPGTPAESVNEMLDVVAGLGVRAAPALVAALRSADVGVRGNIETALARMGAPAVPLLVESLASDQPEVRTAAVRILVRNGAPAHEALIHVVLHDERIEARRLALSALGQIGNGQVLEALLSALQDPDAGVRSNAVRYLGELGATEAVPALIPLAREADGADVALRRQAISSLGAIGDLAAVDALIELLADPAVTDGAVVALRTMGDKAVPALVAALHAPATRASQRTGIWRVIEGIGAAARPDDRNLLGLARTYAQLRDESLAPEQVLQLTKGLAWWEHGEELHRSLETAHRLAASDSMEQIGRADEALAWLPSNSDWLRPHIAHILRDLRNIAESASLYYSLSRREGQREALLKARDAVLSALDRLDETHGLVMGATLPFERRFFEPLVAQWRTHIHATLRTLRGRAELEIALLHKDLPMRLGLVETRAVFQVFNRGDSAARNLSAVVRCDKAYDGHVQVVHGERIALEPLGTGERREVEVGLVPHGARRAALVIEVRYDDDERQAVHQAFSEQVTFVEGPSVYAPIERSPYIVGMPVKAAAMFFGRADVFDWIRENVSTVHQEQPLLLYGERRMGKTSVLYQLLRQPPTPQHLCLLFDLQLYGYAKTTAELLFELTSAIALRLLRERLPVAAPERAAFQADAFGAFRRFCDGLEDILGDRRVLVMMDEFGVLMDKVRSGVYDVSIFDYLRGILQRATHITFLFTGAYEVRRMQQDFNSVLFNMPKVYRITYLSEADATRLIEEPVRGLLDYHPLVVQRIRTITACHPYFVQYICHELLQLARNERRNYVELADLDHVMRNVIQDATGNIEQGIYRHLPRHERYVIAAAASVADDVRVYVPLSDIVDVLDRHHLSIPREQVLDALRALRERDLITEMPLAQQLRYAFRMGLIRMWLKHNEMLLRLAQEKEG